MREKSGSKLNEYEDLQQINTELERKKTKKIKQKCLVKHKKKKNRKPENHDYKCFICLKVFDLISEKHAHVKTSHCGIKICSICNKKKQTAIALESHLRYHFFGYDFLCSTCGKSFKFKNLLENHVKVDHFNSVKFVCDLCSYTTKFKINLKRHLISYHLKQKNFICPFETCASKYSTQVGLNLHMYRSHDVPAPVQCSECFQGFTFESEVRVHKKYCTGSKREKIPQNSAVDILDNGFQCKICQQIFSSRSKWSVHYHHKHKNSNICSICNKQVNFLNFVNPAM